MSTKVKTGLNITGIRNTMVTSNSDIKLEKVDVVGDIEVIEVEMMNDEDNFDDLQNAQIEKTELIDIANIPVNEDVPLELIGVDDNDIKEETLDTEELAILEKDLHTTTMGYEHLELSSNTVGKPTAWKVEKVSKVNKGIPCRFCGKEFASKTTYLRHLLKQHTNHGKEKKMLMKVDEKDPLADIKLSSKSKRAPEESVTEMCHICGKIFRHRSTYRQHLRDQHDPNNSNVNRRRAARMCDLCGKICSGGTFREHMRKHTNPERVTCEHCGKIFSFVSVLKSHIQVRHSDDRPYKCELCPSTFKRADYLRSHKRYKHEPKLSADESKKHQFKCDDCGATFRSPVGLSKHRSQREVKAGEPPRCPALFTCPICSLSFKKRNYLILHKRYVHEKNKPFRISESSIGPYKCDQCDRRFASVCGRNYHCKHTHGTSFNTKFSEVCDHCGLTFHNRVFYAKHVAKLRSKPTCYLCWLEFETPQHLRDHVHQMHVDDLPFLCQQCDNRFVTLRQLNDHIHSKHDLIKPFKCDYCQHSAVRKDSLAVHIRSCHLQEKPYKCDLCDKAFSQSSDVRKHRIIHTRNKSAVRTVTVKLESSSTSSIPTVSSSELIEPDTAKKITEKDREKETFTLTLQTNLERLQAEDEEQKRKSRHKLRICDLCGKNYITDSGFRHHKIMHGEPLFSCHVCGRMFWEAQNLKKHVAALHSVERPFQCHLCGKNYKRKDVLQEHIKRVHDGMKRRWNDNIPKKSRRKAQKQPRQSRYKCPYCNKSLASKCYLQDHINGAHIRKLLYSCEECGQRFTRKAAYKYHFQRAHVLKKLVLEPRGTFKKDCEYCGLQFLVKKYYDLHVANKHLNRFFCHFCDKEVSNKQELDIHVETVHDDQLAKCKQCNKTFIEETHLKRHIYLCHTERNPYECHECGHKANKKSTLAIHMRRHTGEKPYECELCPKKFSQSVDYRKHRKSHFINKQIAEVQADEDILSTEEIEIEEISAGVLCHDIEYETIQSIEMTSS